MRNKMWILAMCLVLGVTTAWADAGSTNPNQFIDPVNWCTNYGCANDYTVFATPQAWVSNGGNTGIVGLVGTGQGFYNLQQGATWNGNMPGGMGLVYNGGLFGNIPTGIAAQLDQSVSGVGAYIQADYFGPFSATITLFDALDQAIFSYTAFGNSDTNTGTALFLGAYSSTPIWAVQFDVVDVYGNDIFAIGTMKLNATPEPSSLVLFGTSALGLAGAVRRRLKGVL